MKSRLKIYFDGGCRPEGMEIAVAAGGRSFVFRDLGPGTRLDAEWLALLQALSLAHFLYASDFVLLGDALDVIGQANGKARIPAPYAALFEEMTDGALPRVRHIGRRQNLAGIALARHHPR